MDEHKVKAMFALANKLDKLDNVLRLKCEICGPVLRGDDPKKYPQCKKHGVR
jgi:rubrerythrin